MMPWVSTLHSWCCITRDTELLHCRLHPQAAKAFLQKQTSRGLGNVWWQAVIQDLCHNISQAGLKELRQVVSGCSILKAFMQDGHRPSISARAETALTL